MHVCALTSASFCSRIWSLSNTSSSTALQKIKIKVKKKKVKYKNAFVVYVSCLSPSPARSLKPLRAEVLIMQILSHLLEVLHVSTETNQQSFIHTLGGTRARQFDSGRALGQHLSTLFPTLTQAWCAAWGSRCVLGSPLLPLPRGTDALGSSFLSPQSVDWSQSLQRGCWPETETYETLILEEVWKRGWKRCLLCASASTVSHLQDPGLLFELLVLVGVGIGQLVDSDPVLCNLIQDLMMESTKTGWNDGSDDLTVTSCSTFYWT